MPTYTLYECIHSFQVYIRVIVLYDGPDGLYGHLVLVGNAHRVAVMQGLWCSWVPVGGGKIYSYSECHLSPGTIIIVQKTEDILYQLVPEKPYKRYALTVSSRSTHQ